MSKPMSLAAIVTWAELEIGSNSDAPWTMANTMICNSWKRSIPRCSVEFCLMLPIAL